MPFCKRKHNEKEYSLLLVDLWNLKFAKFDISFLYGRTLLNYNKFQPILFLLLSLNADCSSRALVYALFGETSQLKRNLELLLV